MWLLTEKGNAVNSKNVQLFAFSSHGNGNRFDADAYFLDDDHVCIRSFGKKDDAKKYIAYLVEKLNGEEEPA